MLTLDRDGAGKGAARSGFDIALNRQWQGRNDRRNAQTAKTAVGVAVGKCRIGRCLSWSFATEPSRSKRTL